MSADAALDICIKQCLESDKHAPMASVIAKSKIYFLWEKQEHSPYGRSKRRQKLDSLVTTGFIAIFLQILNIILQSNNIILQM